MEQLKIEKKRKRFVHACEQTNEKIPDPHNAKERYQSIIRK